MEAKKPKIAVAHGDGIGPEIMSATLHILKEAGASLDLHEVQIGESVYLQGIKSGMAPETWDTLKECDAFLKAPITTPQGGGFKSLNVTIRGAFSLYANIRPCVSYAPYIKTKHPNMDVVIIRENEEDLYAGIEYQHTPDVTEALKLISHTGSERIIRYAFEYAASHGRNKVTCFDKDNILKLTDGLFTQVFYEVAKEYPQIEHEHWIIDIGAAKLADTPENFDVIVMPNLYGDILSDIAAQIAGSVGLAGSANIGPTLAMFEAIHGSAPRRAGQNLANPSGLLLGAVQMLSHIGQGDVASLIQNAWLKTIEDGIHTYDIFKEGKSKQKVGTKEFGEAVASRVGQKPEKLKAVNESKPVHLTPVSPPPQEPYKRVGVDVYVRWTKSIAELAELAQKIGNLTLITNRGAHVWPKTMEETLLTDHFRLRFRGDFSHERIAALLKKLAEEEVDFVSTQNLHEYGGKAAFSSSEF